MSLFCAVTSLFQFVVLLMLTGFLVAVAAVLYFMELTLNLVYPITIFMLHASGRLVIFGAGQTRALLINLRICTEPCEEEPPAMPEPEVTIEINLRQPYVPYVRSEIPGLVKETYPLRMDNGEETKSSLSRNGEETKIGSSLNAEETKCSLSQNGEETKSGSSLSGEGTKSSLSRNGEETKTGASLNAEETKCSLSQNGEETKSGSSLSGEGTKSSLSRTDEEVYFSLTDESNGNQVPTEASSVQAAAE